MKTKGKVTVIDLRGHKAREPHWAKYKDDSVRRLGMLDEIRDLTIRLSRYEKALEGDRSLPLSMSKQCECQWSGAIERGYWDQIRRVREADDVAPYDLSKIMGNEYAYFSAYDQHQEFPENDYRLTMTGDTVDIYTAAKRDIKRIHIDIASNEDDKFSEIRYVMRNHDNYATSHSHYDDIIPVVHDYMNINHFTNKFYLKYDASVDVPDTLDIVYTEDDDYHNFAPEGDFKRFCDLLRIFNHENKDIYSVRYYVDVRCKEIEDCLRDKANSRGNEAESLVSDVTDAGLEMQ